MAILVRCGCGQPFQTSNQNAGREAICPDCGRALVVPKPNTKQRKAPEADPLLSGKAIASFLLGLTSFACVVLTGIPAIILGLIAIVDINQGRGLFRGRRLAIAGIVLGAFGSTVMTLAFLVPALRTAREAFQGTQCANNLKAIGLAFHDGLNTGNSFIPASNSVAPGHRPIERRFGDGNGFMPHAITSETGEPLLSWRVAILAFMGPDEEKLFQKFHLDEPWNSPHNIKLIPEMPDVLRCPSRSKLPVGQTCYQVVVGNQTMFPSGQGVRTQDITDGTSNTIMVLEASNGVIWTEPTDLKLANVAVGGTHSGQFNVLFADGSVQAIDQGIKPADLNAWLTRDGGELVSTGY